MPPDRRTRVPDNTAAHVNEDIQRQIEDSVRYYASCPDGIAKRGCEGSMQNGTSSVPSKSTPRRSLSAESFSVSPGTGAG